MKISSKIILPLCVASCVGMYFFSVWQADDKDNKAEIPAQQVVQALPPKAAEQQPAVNKAQAQPQAAPTAQQQPVMTESSAMPTAEMVLFQHKFHVEKAGFRCIDCHNSIFQQTAGTAKAAGDFNMTAFEQGKYCGVCHDGKTAFAVTDPGSCAKCHGSDLKLPTTLVFEPPVKAVVFNHSKHVDEFSLSCSSCHETPFKMKKGEVEKQPDFTMEAMYKGKYCGACHDGVTAFSAKTRCALCHIGVQGFNLLNGDDKKEAGHSNNGGH